MTGIHAADGMIDEYMVTSPVSAIDYNSSTCRKGTFVCPLKCRSLRFEVGCTRCGIVRQGYSHIIIVVAIANFVTNLNLRSTFSGARKAPCYSGFFKYSSFPSNAQFIYGMAIGRCGWSTDG